MHLLLSLSCITLLQYTTNWRASVIEFKSLKRKDRCVVCSINRVVITEPLKYISVLVKFLKMASFNTADININVHDPELPFYAL
jgi:hypothetical protein